jgi:hypothetical protein
VKPEEEEELKRRQLEALRAAAETKKAAAGCMQGCGCLFIGVPLAIVALLFFVWVWSKLFP